MVVSLTVFFEVDSKIVGHTHSGGWEQDLISKPHINDCRILCTFAANNE